MIAIIFALLVGAIFGAFSSAAAAPRTPAQADSTATPGWTYQIGGMLYPAQGGAPTMASPMSGYGYGLGYGMYPWYFPYAYGISALSTVTVDLGFELLSGGNGGSAVGGGQSWSDSYYWALKLGGGEFDSRPAGLTRLTRLRMEFGYRRPLRRLREPPRDPRGTEDERLWRTWQNRWRQESYAEAQHPEVLEQGWVGSPILGLGLQSTWAWPAQGVFEEGHALAGAYVVGGWEATYRLRFSAGVTGSFGYSFRLDGEPSGLPGHTNIGLTPRFAVNF
ncbi:MAG: hypothetical protein HYV34_03470 [Candidatus Kerfeldbacteria bacterium]|nr:hypothetical protein [Candidatus Kerfeldbacteria bacterium]